MGCGGIFMFGIGVACLNDDKKSFNHESICDGKTELWLIIGGIFIYIHFYIITKIADDFVKTNWSLSLV